MKEKLLEKLWLKPVSIFLVIATEIIVCLPFYPENHEGNTKFYICIVCEIIILAIYIIEVVEKNKLPHCKSGETGVLFILKAATLEQYNEFVFSIENHFNRGTKNTHLKLVPIFINAKDIKKHDITNARKMEKLLTKTKCDFSIELLVESDLPKAPTQYQTSICAGVLHPNVSKSAVDFLMKNLSFGVKPIRKIKFSVDNKIDAISATANYLTVLSEYTIGVLLLMYNDVSESVSVLRCLREKISNKHPLYNMVSEALYEALNANTALLWDKYNSSFDKALLKDIERFLKLSNTVSPGRYDYHLGMACIMFLKYRNISSAKEHISLCKKNAKNDFWQCSEAFLIAYDSSDPNNIYQKYRGLENNSYNMVNIIAFIENVLTEEPHKQMLHIALGVLYDANGDQLNAGCHFKQFMDSYTGNKQIRKNVLNEIKRKIDPSICAKRRELEPCGDCKCCESNTVNI